MWLLLKLIDGQVARIQNNLELQFLKKLLLQIQMLLELFVNNATTIAADLSDKATFDLFIKKK
jgi:hypothetical protein